MFIRWITRSNRKGEYIFCYLSETKWIEGKPKNKTLAALGSISEKPTKPEREVFWMQLDTGLSKLKLSYSERTKIEAAVAAKVPRGINPHGDSDAPVEWYTPPEFIEMARTVLGSIDLDPASNDLAQTWIKAGTYYTASEDGMVQLWFGRVWCNPPYGKNQPKGRKAPDWLEKALSCYENGEIEAAILLFNRSEAVRYKQQLKRVMAICEVHRRISFLNAKGDKQSSPRYNNDFLYLGKDVGQFKQVFKEIGDVTELITEED
jgi:hypothetical protein